MEKHELGSVLHTCLGRVSLFVGCLLRNVVEHALIKGIISLLAAPSISFLGNASFRCWYDEGGQKRRHLQLGFVGVQLFRAFMNGLFGECNRRKPVAGPILGNRLLKLLR